MLEALVEEKFASRLFAQDSTLWGPDAEGEASIRLAWTTLHETSRALIPEILTLRDELRQRGINRVVLCGMGGSSLAPEVICADREVGGVDIVVLDSSQPDMVRSALVDLARTVVVVSSKSGGTVETDSHRRIFEAAFAESGLSAADHFVVVTDPGSPLDQEAAAAGYRVFHADPHVGGRYSALTAFGLVPSGLAGADLGRLLDAAAEIAPRLACDDLDNPGLVLGAQIAMAAREGRNKLVFVGTGFADWAEQLLAESTGKNGTGILPVVVASQASPDETPDSLLCPAIDVRLGAAFLVFEVATAVAGRVLGINPFDQPDVESAKAAAREVLSDSAPAAVGGSIDAAAIDDLLSRVGERDYLAVQVYLDRWAHADFASVRDTLQARLGRPVTFGWGPRFLHSTGQFHKGGTPEGVFLQITGAPVEDLAVPGRDFTLGQFIAAQAAGDARVLRNHGRPVLRLHLQDVTTELPRLRAILR